MGDLIVTCSHCGEETTVSEYVDPDMARCRACEEKLEIPRASMSGPRARGEKKKQKKKRRRVAIEGKPVEQGVATVFQTVSARNTRRKQKRRKVLVWTPNKLTLILIFVFATGILSFVRYSGALSDEGLTKYRLFGVYALGVMYVAVIVDAFNDSMMHGMLSIFVAPFYGLWFLYSACDSFLLRLIVSILLIPFGLDTLRMLGIMGMRILKAMGAWGG